MLEGCLTTIGDLVDDVVVRHHGIRYGTDSVAEITRRRGGSAANTAASGAALVASRFVGRVGADLIGSQLVDELAATGVDVRIQRGGRTGTVVALVDETGERTMLSDRATAAELEPIDPAWLAGSAIVHVPAYGFAADSPAAPIVLAAIRDARSSGALVSVDVSATTLVEAYGVAAFRALLVELAPAFVFANADESALLDLDRDPIAGSTMVLKAGARPATVITPAGERCEVRASDVTRVADTTGAGDAFAAGFLAAVIGGSGAADACAAGHACAGRLLAALASGS